jgi:hypothetical protein
MKKTLTFQVDVPATQISSYAARKTAGVIIDGLDALDRIGAEYDKNAIHEFTQTLRGAAGTYTFDVVINNNYISEAEEVEIMQEITDSLPATHKIISQN